MSAQIIRRDAMVDTLHTRYSVMVILARNWRTFSYF